MKDEFVFTCLGDSLTAGSPNFSGYGTWSGNPKSQYEYWLDKCVEKNFPKLDVEVANFGVGGNTVYQMFYRFKRDILRLMPNSDYIIVFAGINDILGRYAEVEDVLRDLEELYKLILDSGMGVIALEIAPTTVTQTYVKRIKEANDGIHEIAEKLDIKVVPLYGLLTDESTNGLKTEYDIGDGVHFNVDGYKAIGEFVYSEIIEDILKQSSKN